MRRASILLTVLIVSLALAPEASAATPTLSIQTAKTYGGGALSMQQALNYREDSAWIGRCNRLSRTRVSCRTSWATAHSQFSYRGRITIWFAEREGVLNWFWRYRLKRTNDDCLAAASHTVEECTVIVSTDK